MRMMSTETTVGCLRLFSAFTVTFYSGVHTFTGPVLAPPPQRNEKDDERT